MNYPYLSDSGAPFPLADDRTTRSVFQGTEDEEVQAHALLRGVTAISLHEHPTRLPEPLSNDTWTAYRGLARAFHGFDGLRASGTSAFFVNAWSFAPPEDVIQFLARARTDASYAEGVFIAETTADLDRTVGAGGDEVALYLSLESITAFDDDVRHLEVLFGIGVRMFGLCYNDGNAFGEGIASEDRDAGLTKKGAELVRLANELGIVIDLGHVGDQTCIDTIEASDAPVVISHAGARSLWDTWRMKPDTVLRALAAKGGVLGISAAPNTTRSQAHPQHTIESFLDHLEYAAELMGIDHVGLGPDTMFGDHAAIHQLGRGDGQWGAHSGRERGGLVPHVDGVENPRENFVHIVIGLRRRGWSDDDIERIVGRNMVRVMNETLRA